MLIGDMCVMLICDMCVMSSLVQCLLHVYMYPCGVMYSSASCASYLNYKHKDNHNYMRGIRVPKITRHANDGSISLSHQPNHCSLIWLHGLGDSSEGFLSYFTHSLSPLYRGVRIRLLQAPTIPVTINNFQQMPSWYDIRSLSRFKGEEQQVFDMHQVKQSTEKLKSYVEAEVKYWIDREKNSGKNNSEGGKQKYSPRQEEHEHEYEKGISQQSMESLNMNPYHRVFVGGFSQGGVIALRYALTAPHPPAGCMAVSSYLMKSTPLTNLRKVPFLLIHGNKDQKINQLQAKHSYSELIKDQNLVQYQVRDGLGHSADLQSLDIMNKWFQDVNNYIKKHYESYPSQSSQNPKASI